MTDFRARFQRAPEAAADAPGRVNLIGEHTDYNGGYVLPIALPLRTTAEIARRTDHEVHAFSADLPPADAAARYRRGAEARTGTWIDYVQGVTQALAGAGHEVGGFDLLVRSTVPVGAGLGSSAALELAVLRALRALHRLPIDDVQLALIGHRAETGLVGAPVGVMDQLASSLADEQRALFIDTRTLETARIPMPDGAALAILDSGITHGHASGEYRVRRAECERAAALLGVAELRDATVADLPRIQALPAPLDRRARHVVTENARVLEAVQAMRAGDLAALGRLWLASHASMRDDFETSLPEIDAIVDLAAAEPDVFGARLTGGGFGGCVIVLCRAGTADRVAHRIRWAYHERVGRPGRVLLPINAESWHEN